MRLTLFILTAALAFAQADVRRTIIPGQSNTDTGILGFRELNGTGNHEFQISAQTAMAATIRARWPAALPLTSGECLKSTTAGLMSFGPCPAPVTALDYNWTQTITAPGAAGAKTITLTPGPLGVRATDTTSQYWMIGTAGASEIVVSTGVGTCDGTALSSCTINVVTANSHTGATTLQSATAGAQELWNVTTGACPSIRLGAGLRQFYGSLLINDCVTLVADPDGSTAIHANRLNAPAISIVYAGVNGRTAYVQGRISVTSIGTHTAGSASVLIEGYTDGGVRGIYCFNPYRCVDWYANNSGGGNPVSVSDIRSSGTLHTAVYMRSAGTGHTAGFIDHIYADGAAGTGIRIGGQTAGFTMGDLWMQLIGIGISFEQLAGSTINEITVGAPCIIDGAQTAAINFSAATQPGTNGILVHGCFFAMDSGGIPIVASGMERLSLKNNWIRQSGANYGIAVTAGKHIEITGNTIHFENAAGTAFGIGLVTTASTDVRIADNVIRRVTGAGAATGMVFQALSYTAVDHCDNRFYGLTTDITDTSTAGVTSCKFGAAAAPLTLTLSSSSYTQPLTVRNENIGAHGSCVGVSSTDSASSTVHTTGRLCGKFETASFANELVVIQTTTGSGTFEDAISIKNTLVTMNGGIVAGASNISSLTMAGNQTPGISGLGSIGTSGTRYGAMFSNTGNFAGVLTATGGLTATGATVTLLPGAAPTIGDIWTASSTGGVGGWAAAGGVTAPLTLSLGAVGYSEPLYLENPTVGLNGTCAVLSGHDGTASQRRLGRLCAKFDSAVFTDELVSLMTATGIGTWETAQTWKNMATTFYGVATHNSHIYTSAADTNTIGVAGTPFLANYSKVDSAEEQRIVNPASSHATYWNWILNTASTIRLFSGSGAQVEMDIASISATDTQVGIRGSLYPLATTGSNGDIGYSGTRWRKGWLIDLDLSGVLTIGSCTTVGHVLTAGAGGVMACAAASGGAPFIDSTAIIKGSIDATKLLAFEVDGFTTLTTRTLTAQNASYTIAGTNLAQTFSGANTFSVGQTMSDITPATSNTHTSGSAASYWNQVRSETFFVENSGRIRPTTTNTGSVGISTARFNKAWFTDLDITGIITAPSGSTGVTTTLTCPALQAVKNITISGGVVTSASCGVP